MHSIFCSLLLLSFLLITSCSPFNFQNDAANGDSYQREEENQGAGEEANQNQSNFKNDFFAFNNSTRIPIGNLFDFSIDMGSDREGDERFRTGIPRESEHVPLPGQDDPLLQNFSNYDYNMDGINEIEKLESLNNYIYFSCYPSTYSKLLLVLVEPRLIEIIPGSDYYADDVIEALNKYNKDLYNEGFCPLFISAKVYSGTNHQDGRTVLAIREFFRAVKETFPNFTGAVLVGDFPETLLVRRAIWRRNEVDVTINGVEYKNVNQLNMKPGIIAHRSEIVLSDLDGKWESIYVEKITKKEGYSCIPKSSVGDDWPKDNQFIPCTAYEKLTSEFQDFFYINDAIYSENGNFLEAVWTDGTKGFKIISAKPANSELSESDKSLSNPVAVPDITVSRINPIHIAVNPKIDGFLDDDGKPQSVTFDDKQDKSKAEFWKRDPNLERNILIDYFDRNHKFRNGGYNSVNHLKRIATINGASNLGDNTSIMIANLSEAEGETFDDQNNIGPGASLLQYVEWLKEPSILRGIVAHSEPISSDFGVENDYNYNDLEQITGNSPWDWEETSLSNGKFLYKPSYEKKGVKANLYLYRAIWENKILENVGPAFYAHGGCEANSPWKSPSLRYNDVKYGTFQNAEGILFYLNGLAIITRAKVFNDTIEGFELFKEDNFGSVWHEYFNIVSSDSALFENIKKGLSVPSGKRPYFWSILGDWTLKIKY